MSRLTSENAFFIDSLSRPKVSHICILNTVNTTKPTHSERAAAVVFFDAGLVAVGFGIHGKGETCTPAQKLAKLKKALERERRERGERERESVRVYRSRLWVTYA